MKHFLKIVFLVLFPFPVIAQQNVDSLKRNLAHAMDDSSRYHACWDLYNYYEEANRDSALHYAEFELSMARKNGKRLTEILSLNHKGYQLIGMGRYAEALQCLFDAFKIAEDRRLKNEKTWLYFTNPFNGDNRLYMLSYTHHIFAILMWQTQNQEQEIFHFREARRLAVEAGHTIRELMADMNLGRGYISIGKLDSSIIFEKEAERLALKANFKKYLGQVYQIIADVYYEKGNRQQELNYDRLAIRTSLEQKNLNSLSANYFLITKYFLSENQKDSALYYALKNMEIFRTLGPVTGLSVNLGTIYQNIYLAYKLNNRTDSAYKYQGLALNAIDSLSKIRIKNLAAFQNVGFNEQLRLQNIEKEKIVYQNKVRSYFFLGGIGLLLLLAIIFYRNNRQKHKAKIKIEKAYEDLKATQQQLVQSEKMASLGELTAGIAHEIQNPLNFVNNFSEVNKELIVEMKNEIDSGNLNEAKIIANDIGANEEKIIFHGKRADAIVKSMLQHSRASAGKKEPTDINALCDEYLRLAYHGLRAKDKTFSAKFETDFDLAIEKINVVPQEIGRVILNLINNAFYAVSEKKRLQADNYEPKVIISTRVIKPPLGGLGVVEVKVKDNGNGIPESIKEKIFQPFFTTKPTGSGTGLGLSLSYDIIKAHGGDLKVQAKEGEGSEFIIQLP